MNRRRVSWLLVVLVSCAGFAAAAAVQEPNGVRYDRLVITGGMLVDGLGTPMRGPVNILVEGDTITNIIPVDEVSLGGYGPDFERPTGDRVIDAKGMYVLPGLVEMHGHIPQGRVVPSSEWGRSYAYQLWLAHGVTTVRDVGSGAGLDVLVEDRRRSAGNEIVAPRIIAYKWWPRGGRAKEKGHTPQEARALVQAFKKAGADGIKLSGPAYTDIITALCDEADKLGMGVATDLKVGQVDAVVAARAGVTSIEHWYGIPDAAIPGVQRLPADYNYYDELDRFRYAGKLWRDADRCSSKSWTR